MSVLKHYNQGIVELSQADFRILINSFPTNRKAQGCSSETVSFYSKEIKVLLAVLS
jgi:hypothetical protein